MAKLNTTTIQDVTNKMSLGVLSSTNNKNYFEEQYAWTPQLDKSDIFSETIPSASNSAAADTNVTNNPTMLSKLTDYQLDEIPASNGQGYSCFATPGNTSSTRFKNFITPQKYGNGYGFELKDSTTATIPLTAGAYQFDYQNGIFRFNEGNTPADMGWSTPLTVTVYRYIGTMLADEASGSSVNDAWRQPATYLDNIATVFDNTAAPLVDGQALVDGDIVLFTALLNGAENNRVYIVSDIGTAAVYTLREDGQTANGDPVDGDSILVKAGTANADSQFKFDGTNWIEAGGSFNLVVEESDGIPTGSNINKLVVCPGPSDDVYIDGTTAYIHAPPAPSAIDIDDNLTEFSGRLSQSNVNYNGAEPAGTDVTNISRTTDIPTSNTFFSIPASFRNANLSTLSLVINGTTIATIDLSANFNEGNRLTGQVIADYDITGAGDTIVDGTVTFANGTFVLNSVASAGPIFANPYQKGSCTINITNMAAFRQGYNTVVLLCGSDLSSQFGFFYDIDAGANPIITSSDLSEDTPVLRYLSGVPFYDTGSTFDYDVVIDNAFNNVYHSSNSPVTVDGFPDVAIAPIPYTDPSVTGVSSPPDIAETMTVTDYTFTVIAGSEDNDVQIDAIPRDPYGVYITDTSTSKGISINSVVASSTVVLENFVDENYRFPRTTNFNVVPGALTGNWTSATSLTTLTSELQVYNEDGTTPGCLTHPSVDYSTARLPIGPDYSGLSGGANYEYIRVFQGTIDESNGILDLPGGIVDTDITGNNVVIDIKVPTKTDWLRLNNDYSGSSFEDNVKFVNTSWAGSTITSLDEWVIPTTPNGYKYKCTLGGTTNTVEPVWPTTVGNDIGDGTVTWTCYQIDNQEGCRIDPTVYSPALTNSIRFTLGTFAADASVSRCIFVRIRYLGNAQSDLLEAGFGISDW